MRRDLALVVLLGTGGWVCSSSEPCSGKLHCDTDVGDVCCPPGSPYYCDGACSTTACAGAVACRYPDETDDGVCPIALVTATIDSADCTTANGVHVVTATGTATGCGSGTIVIGASSATDVATSTVECGSWTSRGAMCSPDSADTSDTATWHLNAALPVSSSASEVAKIVVTLDAVHDAVLATHTIACP